MDLADCRALGAATRGCRLVLLTATDAEAEPLRGALAAPESYTVATKRLFVGRLEPGPGPAPDDPSTGPVRAVLAISGCDKANAAHLLTCLLQAMRPKPLLVLQVGLGGAFAYRGQEGGAPAGARVGDIVLATEEIYSDTGSSSPDGWLSAHELALPLARVSGAELGGCFPLDAHLVRAASVAIESEDWPEPRPRVVTGPCVTVSRVTGLLAEGEEIADRWGAVAESMEGAAAAHICALYDVAFLEVRGISNLVVDRDRQSWEVERALAVSARAALAVGAALGRLPLVARGAPAVDAGAPPPDAGKA